MKQVYNTRKAARRAVTRIKKESLFKPDKFFVLPVNSSKAHRCSSGFYIAIESKGKSFYLNSRQGWTEHVS